MYAVIPDNRFCAANERIQNGNCANKNDADYEVKTENDLQNHGGQEQPQRVANISRNEKQTRGRAPTHSAEAGLKHFVSRKWLTFEIKWQQYENDCNPADNVTDRNLQKSEVTAGRCGEPRDTQKRNCARFGRDDR